ncbi:cytochrome P450, partial [Cokeromyces recurvatus]|uniref:cytochrome P450 n=1 Tax=Cokeromyces recurvatus TaxID=90255 RepID=UPI002220AC32
MMGIITKIGSYLLSIVFTVLLSKVGQSIVWSNKREDGSTKSPWAPSPSNLPFLTKGLDAFQRESYQALTRWFHDLKAPIYSVQLGLKRIIVLNTPQLVYQALIEKEQLNSSRNSSDTMERILSDQCKTVYTAPFSLYWSRIRRAIYLVIGQKYVAQFTPFFKEQAKRVSIGIEESMTNKESNSLDTAELRQLVDVIAMDTALSLVLGRHQQQQHYDPAAMLSLIQKCHALEARQTRKYNRLGQFYRFINAWLDVKSLFTLDSININLRNGILEILYPWFEPIYKIRSSDEERRKLKLTSIATSLLNIDPSKNDPNPVQLTKDEILVNVMHIVLHAHTYLASSLFTLIQRLATEPDFQNRLLHSDSSEERLRLASAFVSETLRLDPPNRLLAYGPRTDYDFEAVDGTMYRVDQDTDLVVNLDAIHHDPHYYYPNPDTFYPDRFLKPETHTTTLLSNSSSSSSSPIKPARDHLAFGAGRRACLGKSASEQWLATTVIQLVKSFELRGGDVSEKIQVSTNIWSWVGRTETKGDTIKFI